MDEDVEQIKIWIQKTFGEMADSAVFLGIFNYNYAKDSTCLMQFALAVLLDKPLFLLIEKGTHPGKHLIRILEGYEFYEPEDNESKKQALEKLGKKINKFLSKSK